MREDPAQSDSFKTSQLWSDQRYTQDYLIPIDQAPETLGDDKKKRKFVSNSLSGNERNRMFLRAGDDFEDVSLVSGADDLADGRSFGVVDYDQDGWLDIALMSLNAPRFKLYHNDLKIRFPDRRSVRVRLVGGQTSGVSSDEFSNRDGVGAKVLVEFESGKKVLLHRQAGEGFASQNSRTLQVGLGSSDSVAKILVDWPSGKTTVVDSPDTNEVVVVNETE